MITLGLRVGGGYLLIGAWFLLTGKKIKSLNKRE